MKKQLIKVTAVVTLVLINFASFAQSENYNSELANKSKAVLQEMIDKAPKLQTYYDESYGYAVFPKVTKGAITVGGAAGTGVLFQNHEMVSTSKLKQLTIGVQVGGQQYSEVIFFENKEAFDKFLNEKLKFDAQASAVVLKSGVSADAVYAKGVAVFTQAIGGLMYEASIGGQHFHNKVITQ